MTDRSLYTYAMAKSLYDKRNGDILDILVPFIVIIVNKDESGEGINKSRIQSSLKENYNLKIPLYVLKSIITRAKRKKYLSSKRRLTWLKLVKYFPCRRSCPTCGANRASTTRMSWSS